MEKEDLNKLEEYARLEGTEIGELCKMLIGLYQSYQPFIQTKSFKKALDRELSAQLSNFKKYSKIVEREKKIIEKWKELEWD